MDKNFEKAINRNPLKPNLAEMQNAVDEWREDEKKILNSMKAKEKTYHKDKAKVEAKIAKLLDDFLTEYEVTVGEGTGVIAPYGFVNGFKIVTEMDRK